MNEPFHNEIKKEFQLERLILFSDAVFAIAITLLVLEIKVPDIPGNSVTDALLLQSLDQLLPKFAGFIVSFFIIGLYWTIHHRMFGAVVNYTRRLIWLNLFFLFAVVLMPFSTAFYSEYVLYLLKIPVIIYVLNICFLGIMNFVLWRYLSNPKRKLVEGISKTEAAYFSMRAVAVPLTFIAMGAIYLFISPAVAIWIPPFVPVIMGLIKRRYSKKLTRPV